jgi:hypothetical protein
VNGLLLASAAENGVAERESLEKGSDGLCRRLGREMDGDAFVEKRSLDGGAGRRGDFVEDVT